MSPIVYEVLDFACGITDRRAQVVAQTNGLTLFTGTFGPQVEATIRKFGLESMRAGRRLHDQQPVRGRDAHVRRVPRPADPPRRRARRVRSGDHALDRDRRQGAGQHLARLDGDLPGGPPAPVRPALPRGRARRGDPRHHPGERAAAARRHGRRERIGGGDRDRRAARRRGLRALRRRRARVRLRRDPRPRRADRPGRAEAGPERDVRRGGRDRRRRADGRPDSHPGRGHGHRRLARRRLHRHRAADGGAGELQHRGAPLGLQDGRPRDHEPVGAEQRRLLPALRAARPAGHGLQRGAAGTDGLVLRGVRVRDRARLEGAGPGRPRSASGRELREPVRRVHRRHGSSRRGLRPRGAERRRLGRRRGQGRRERAHRDDRRRHVQLPGRGGRSALPDPRRALRAERGRRRRRRPAPRRPRRRSRVQAARRRAGIGLRQPRRLAPPPLVNGRRAGGLEQLPRVRETGRDADPAGPHRPHRARARGSSPRRHWNRRWPRGPARARAGAGARRRARRLRHRSAGTLRLRRRDRRGVRPGRRGRDGRVAASRYGAGHAGPVTERRPPNEPRRRDGHRRYLHRPRLLRHRDA